MLHSKLMLTLALTAAAAIPVGASSPASADAGTPFSISITFPSTQYPDADGFCSFRVQMSYTGTISVLGTAVGDDATTTEAVRTGTATLTSLSTGKTLTYTVGAHETTTDYYTGTTTLEARGADLTWRNIYWAEGLAPTIEYTTGVLTETASHYGYLIEHDVVGRSVDVCTALS